MLSKAKSDFLLGKIRDGSEMTRAEKLNLIYMLSIPSILAQITSVMMFFIDQAMVARIGVEASAACGLVESSTWLFGSLTTAASMGFSVQVAHFIGASDFQQARSVFRHGLLCTTLFSVLLGIGGIAVSGSLPYWLGGQADIAADATIYFMVFMFVMPFFQLNNLSGAMLKCAGNMRVPSVMNVVMCVMDVIFNYILIFIFHLGVLGAALGTALAIVIAACVQAYFAIFRSEILSLVSYPHHQVASHNEDHAEGSSSFTFNTSYLLNAVKISLPMAAQSLLMSGAQIVSTVIVAPLGKFAIAANTFAITAESLCYMPGFGIGEAATTLVGQSMGAQRKGLCISFARMSVFTGMLVMTLMGVIMYLTAPELMGLMTPVDSIRDLGARCLRIEAFAEPFFAASIVAYSVFVGAGDTLRPAVINLGSMWLVRLTLAALLAKSYGLPGVWFAMAVELTFRGVLFLIHLFRGRWMKLKEVPS